MHEIIPPADNAAPYQRDAKSSKAGRRTHAVTVRLNATEHDQVTRLCEKTKLPLAVYLRVAVLGQHHPGIHELNLQGLEILGGLAGPILTIADAMERLQIDDPGFRTVLAAWMRDIELARLTLFGAFHPTDDGAST